MVGFKIDISIMKGTLDMNDTAKLHEEAYEMLKETSRTFLIPISYLSPGLKETVSSAYLCMRAIDEIEDHPELEAESKDHLLRSISELLKKPVNPEDIKSLFNPYKSKLPEVTLRLYDWIRLCPAAIKEKVLDSTSTMAKGMADWTLKGWNIRDEKDLDDYTFYVAGLVGVMLSDIWKWHDNTETKKDLAIAFGRGLQSVNILRNKIEDKERGVSFYPDGWDNDQMFSYARRNLALADAYIKDITSAPILNFCRIPLALAHGTLSALSEGKEKMNRDSVNATVKQVVAE